MKRDVPLTPHEQRALDAERTPLRLYGQLFIDVQMQDVLNDGKTFVDALPRRLPPAMLVSLYEQRRHEPGFSLTAFVAEHFLLPLTGVANSPWDGILERIRGLWPQLVRSTANEAPPLPGTSTLLPLPHPYVVPGGRFREVYYWDSYFTMLGLVEDGYRPLAEDMLRNFASLIDRYGFIPNSNRSYMLSRSQPPFFFKMVQCAAPLADEGAAYALYLPQLKAEYAYWMEGEVNAAMQLPRGEARGHLVHLPDGALLNRYWDDCDHPREESYRDDVITAQGSDRPAEQVYRELRAGAESGWDFSSRWCADPQRLDSIETTEILPVDLNSLLWGLECAIAQGCTHAGDGTGAQHYAVRAQRRKQAIDRYLWSEEQGHYVDYQWVTRQQRPQLTAAALVPLYLGVASDAQAQSSAHIAQTQLLTMNGLQTTLLHTGQQWDAPNGWAPLQWMAAQGLLRYGHTALARDIASRWLGAVHRVYLETGRLLEKYDVAEFRPGGGGEYATQDGFGWTNATYVTLRNCFPVVDATK
jgi:alpha,alpha-trehalase